MLPAAAAAQIRLAAPVRPAAEDCLSYNAAGLKIVPQGTGWLLMNGAESMLLLSNKADAEKALVVAKQNAAHCFIGRNNQRADRKRYIVEYWKGTTTAMAGEDCVNFNPATVNVYDRGALGWRLENGPNYLVLFDNQADANRGLLVAKASTGKLCFIGRGTANTTTYWR
jgi:hypothetical protein